jgi:hypothetical protein
MGFVPRASINTQCNNLGAALSRAFAGKSSLMSESGHSRRFAISEAVYPALLVSRRPLEWTVHSAKQPANPDGDQGARVGLSLDSFA